MTESIDTISYEIKQVAIRLGIADAVAGDLAKAMIDQIKKSCGGSVLYVPKPSKTERDRGISKMFNGVNMSDVRKVYDVSKATVYRAMEREKNFRKTGH